MIANICHGNWTRRISIEKNDPTLVALLAVHDNEKRGKYKVIVEGEVFIIEKCKDGSTQMIPFLPMDPIHNKKLLPKGS